MKAIWQFAVLGALALAIPATAAFAQGAQPVELKGDVKVDKVVTENGKERHVYVAPDVVVPGDRLVFSTVYRNVGADEVKNFVVTNPIPQGVMLMPDAADTLDLSVDGGKSWGKLVYLTIPDGQGATRPAQASDVTHVRWTLASLKPGAEGTLTYNATVR